MRIVEICFRVREENKNFCWSKATQIAKYDFSRELEKTLSEESRRERESVCKISFFREVKENFFQNLEFREENENLFFKILTIENITRNGNYIVLSRSRISSMSVLAVNIFVRSEYFRPCVTLMSATMWVITMSFRCFVRVQTRLQNGHPKV